jgi:chemotaxis protein methyltransferase WspC
MQRIENRLRAVMGLDAETIGSSAIHRIVRLRMKAMAVAQVDDYERILNTNATEWNHLVEAVVITETWFFRDRQAFAALSSTILLELLPKRPTGRIQILSLPCSSGEEPYSIAMALLDAGVPAGRFAIDGVDLSQRALAKAMSGVYGKNSFRGKDLAFRDGHFKPEGDNYVLSQKVRDCVTFQQANLLSDTFNLGLGRYDFIFCRNLLIYFDRETQRQAFRKLDALLARGGTLFVGPAEVPLAMENGFAAVNAPMAFACRRAHEGAPAAGRKAAGTVKLTKPQSALPALTTKSTPSGKPQPASAKPPGGDLHKARQLADSGKLDEAARICQAHLEKSGASPVAFYLLGVIHDAQGSPDAREFYRKALYLDPNHEDSLLQMALLAEKEGDAATARNLRRRAQRLQPQEG